MSRSNYSDDIDPALAALWSGAVRSAINGRRGQRFLRELRAGLDAMPLRRLIAHELETAVGEYCAMGVVGAARGLDMGEIDPEDPEEVAAMFGVAEALVQEIAYENDEGGHWQETPETRWIRMRIWVSRHVT